MQCCPVEQNVPPHGVVDSANSFVRTRRDLGRYSDTLHDGKREVPPYTPSKIRKAKPSYAKLGFFTPVHGGQWVKLRNRIINYWLQSVFSESHGVRVIIFHRFELPSPGTGKLSNFQVLDIPRVLKPSPAPILHVPVTLFHVMCLQDWGSNILLSMWHS